MTQMNNCFSLLFFRLFFNICLDVNEVQPLYPIRLYHIVDVCTCTILLILQIFRAYMQTWISKLKCMIMYWQKVIKHREEMTSLNNLK